MYPAAGEPSRWAVVPAGKPPEPVAEVLATESSTVAKPSDDKYVFKFVNATCFIVPLSLVTNLSASTSVVDTAEVSPSIIFISAAVAVIAVPAIAKVVAEIAPALSVAKASTTAAPDPAPSR